MVARALKRTYGSVFSSGKKSSANNFILVCMEAYLVQEKSSATHLILEKS